MECEPNQFSILQGIGGLDGMSVLPYNIGIGKWSDTEEKDLYYPIKGLEKNKKTPATGVANGLKTRSVIRPGMRNDTIRIPIYQGDYNSEFSNPVLNNWITDVIISGESLPALLPEGSDVDITIKVDRSEQMLFSAYFPLIDHTEELKIQIKQTEPLTEEKLYAEISKAKRTARAVNAIEISNKLEALEQQLENEKGSADGKMKIWDGMRKELFKLDEAEKSASWPKLERELKDVFYEVEDLVTKIKHNSSNENLNMEKIDAHIREYKEKVEQVIKEKNRKEAKELVSEISSLDFELRNAVTGNAMDVQYLQHFNSAFGSFHWKDANKARQLINQGLQLTNAGKTSAIRPVLVEIIGLMSDEDRGKINTGTLK
jgi:molecular chaperone DnaK